MAVKKFSLEAVIDLTDKMTKPMQNIEKNMTGFSKKMQKNFGGVGNNLKSIDAGINKAAVGIGVGLAAIGAGAVALGNSFLEAARGVEALNTQYATVFGKTAGAEMTFVSKEANRLGLAFDSLSRGYIKLAASAMGTDLAGEQTRKIFSAVSDAASALKMTSDETDGALLAISQMMSKGTVSAEELRGQLGERLPGAFNIAAEAMGVSTSQLGDMMKKGQVLSKDFLPKFAALLEKKFAPAAAEAANGFLAIEQRFKNVTLIARQKLGGVLIPIMTTLYEKLTPLIDKFIAWTEANKALINTKVDEFVKRLAEFDLEKFAGKIVEIGKSVMGVLGFIRDILPVILILVAEIKLVTLAMTVYSTVAAIAGVASLPLTAIILGIMVAVALLSVGIYMLIKHWDSVKQFFADFGNGILFVLGPLGRIISSIIILTQSLSGIGAAFKNGGFIEGIKAIGATILQMIVKPISQLLTLVSKIPGIGGAFSGIAGGLASVSSGLDQTINGHKDNYVNPSTRTAASSSTTTTTRNVVDLQAPNGWGMVPQGFSGAPRQTLNFGGAQ